MVPDIAGMLLVLLAAALLVGIWVATALAVGSGLREQAADRLDAVFWYIFAGVLAAVVVVLAAAAAAPGSAAVLGVFAAAASLPAAAAAWLWRSRQERRRCSSQAAAQWEAVRERHDVLLTRWLRYELDADCQIDHPCMTDVRHPATAAMVRAMARAGRLRDGMQPDADAGSYAASVAEFERLLEAAEAAAGIRAIPQR
jgi:hypothetical protein